ncbi:hypothetical protein [Asanoa sp. NPDC050611]|uniref:hypothetical protein n=1 Tax=Asanoa sp. NPDC050611 TaxID=3157098 RepID=UPI0033C1C213
MASPSGHTALAAASVVVASVAGLVGNYLVDDYRTTLLWAFIGLVTSWAFLEGIRAWKEASTSRRAAKTKQVFGDVEGEAVGVDGPPGDVDLSIEQSAKRVAKDGRMIGWRTTELRPDGKSPEN